MLYELYVRFIFSLKIHYINLLVILCALIIVKSTGETHAYNFILSLSTEIVILIENLRVQNVEQLV